MFKKLLTVVAILTTMISFSQEINFGVQGGYINIEGKSSNSLDLSALSRLELRKCNPELAKYRALRPTSFSLSSLGALVKWSSTRPTL